MVLNGFCTVREQMVIFVKYMGRNSKKNSFFEKKL